MKIISRTSKQIVIFLAVFIIAAAAPILAGVTENVDLDFEVPKMLDLRWAPADSGDSVQLTGVNKIKVSDFLLGYVQNVNGGSLIVASNTLWDLNVVANNDYFTGGSGVKPASDVFIDLDLLSAYTYQLNGVTPVTIFIAQPPSVEIHNIKYKILLNPSDSVGMYSLDLTYTLLEH
jgi:hypothetical protein